MIRTHRKVGYFRSELYPDLPTVESFRDETWDKNEKALVTAYLDSGDVLSSYRGFSTCRVCSAMNGSQDLSDGEWVWPSGYSHYLKEHHVKPPIEFLNHVRRQIKTSLGRARVESNRLQTNILRALQGLPE